MKNLLFFSLLLISLSGFSQKKIIVGTIWCTEPIWSEKNQDSIYYSITFKEKKAVLKCKRKSFAKVRIIEEIDYEVNKYDSREYWNKPPSGEYDDTFTVTFTKSWHSLSSNIYDDRFGFYTFGVQGYTAGPMGEVSSNIFHLKTENTLDETVWVTNNYNLFFKNGYVYLQHKGSDQSNAHAVQSSYKLDGDKINIKEISNKLIISKDRQSIKFYQPHGGFDTYKRVYSISKLSPNKQVKL